MEWLDSEIPMLLHFLCSSVVCVFVLIFSTKRNKKGFHKWKLIDRVGVYIAITDLLFYITQVALMGDFYDDQCHKRYSEH
jgi:hypothetical protein